MSEFFCSNCNNFMIYKFDAEAVIKGEVNKGPGLVRKCTVCDFQTEALDSQVVACDGLSDDKNDDSSINANFVYDRTRTHTSEVKCLYLQCPTNTDDVKSDVITYHHDKDRRLAFFCCICKHHWHN